MWSSIRRRFEMPADLPKLSEELTRLFFGPVIDRRVAYLAGERGDQESSEDRRYFFEEARKTLQRQVRSHSQAWEFDRVRIKRTLTELDLATPAEFRRVLETAHSDRTWRGRFQKHPLARKRSAGVVLLAIQEAALAIIPEAYPGKGRPADEDLLSEISRLVHGVLVVADNLASGLQVDETLIPLGLALARLHLTQARAGHKIWLPLRPIPAAPLSREEVVDHYAGRDDRDALHLARQVRAGDGVILVTGYRGVGKSSFVNRVIHHVLEAQKELPRDGRLVVPVALNLAKASGVQSVLRLTLRAIRRSLLDEKNAAPLQVPGNGKVLLPLQQAERQAIQEAYLRATYKVAMSHQDTAERKWEFESALGLDAGKLLAPAAGWGFGLGKIFSGLFRRSRTEKVQKELSLLDYDETAAEDDICRIIRSLSEPHTLAGGKVARIKLVLIFDELDKMDFCSGVKPMLEGLKNLFLERNIVFLLVTSKQFYYKLLDARSVEDDPLSSYFSNIVHVPLLSFPQVRAMLDDWLDHRALGDFPRLPHETEFLDDLACYLTYHTLGNPREIIRMLREKQEWESAAGTPALTDAIAATPGFRVYAAIQEAIEQAVQPGSAVFERFGRDQGVLEQIRRGLYIFTEKVIDRKVLAHDSEDFKRLHKDNFSLIPLDEAWGIAVETARLLEAVHQKAQCVPLFSYQPQVIRATDDFYAVTGRKAPPGEQTEEDILQRAEGFAALHGWPERNSALHLIGQIEPAKLSPVLKRLLAETLTKDENPSHRFAAARQLKAPILFADSQFDLSALLEHEKDSAVLGVLLSLVSEAPASERDRVVSALLTFLDKNTHAPGSTQQSAFKLIAQFADRDVTDALLQWFRRPRFTGAEVEGAALEALAAVAVRHQVDLAERIISDEELLRSFTDWALPVKRSLGTMLWEASA